MLRDEGGQATVEYIFLLSISIFGAVTLARGLFGALDRAVLVLGGTLEKDLKTGRAPLNVWQN